MHNKQTMMISVDGILILELHSLHCQGAMIFLFFGKCSIFTQDLLCVTLTKRYGLMWNPVEHFPKISLLPTGHDLTEMEKAADAADTSVLFLSAGANF